MDIQLHYMEQGRGEPLILIHGNGGNYHYFQHQIEYFSREYHVYALDTRGHGESPRGEKPFTIRQFADDISDFMDQKGMKKAHILGFSDGGNIAMVFALKYPQKVKKLILNAANLYPLGVKMKCMGPILLKYPMAVLQAHKSPEAKRHAEYQKLLVDDPYVNAKELKHLTMHTLVLVGTEDLIRESHTRLIYRSLPNAEIAYVEGGHGIAEENPQQYNRVVERFLKKMK